MLLEATHTTTYLYSEPVSICHTEVHLTPRDHWGQTVEDHQLSMTPQPDVSLSRKDYFGNAVTYFLIHEPHQTLTVTSRSLVKTRGGAQPELGLTPGWDQVREAVRKPADEDSLLASEFVYESPLIQLGNDFALYAAELFPTGQPLLEGALALSRRIHRDFEYDPRATTVTTPVREVLETSRGVCQDFAQFMIACLRSLGLPARYVSGYLRSGQHSVGADASHAWVAVWCPGFGWLDFDPTNDVMPSEEHITLAWGRDYSDVTPVRGVALGGGQHIINVSVSVKPVATA